MTAQPFAYELVAPRTLVRRDIASCDEPLAAGDVLAATEFSVVSTGTELAAWAGKPPLRPSTAYPRLVGYCNLARVLEVGASVTGIRAGDYILTHQSHRSHFRCPQPEVLLYVRDLDREMRKRLTATYLYHLGYVSLLTGGYTPGHEVAVVGLGTLGFTTASLTAAFGGQPLVFSGRAADSEGAGPAGAIVLPKAVPPPEFWETRLGMGGVDIVVNTSDIWADHRLSLQLARKGGTIVLLGFPGRGAPHPDYNPLDSQYVYDRQLTLRQAGHVCELPLPAYDVRFTLKRNMLFLSRLVLSGTLDPAPLLALQAPARDLAAVYETLLNRSSNSYSALIDWSC